METIQKKAAATVMVVVLEETAEKLEQAHSVLGCIESCAGVYWKLTDRSSDEAVSALEAEINHYPSLNLLVITAPESKSAMKTALALARVAKERHFLSVVLPQLQGEDPTAFMEEHGLTMDNLLHYTDCVLCTQTYRDLRAFYCSIASFLCFMIAAMSENGFIYMDMNDIRSVLKDAGFAVLSIDAVKGADEEERKAQMANQKLVPQEIAEKAKGAIIYMIAAEEICLGDVEEAVVWARGDMPSDCTVLFGAEFDEQTRDALSVAVLTVVEVE